MLEVPEEQVVNRLQLDNPWWEPKARLGDKLENFPRRAYLEPFLKLVTRRDPVRAVVLLGPRRVGKTVMVNHAIGELLDDGVERTRILYVSIETPVFADFSLEQILALFQQRFGHDRHAPLFVFFDEIQYLKNWEVHLKSLVDTYPDYKFVCTGSAAAALKLKSNESGAGRFSDFMLPPLTFSEYIRFVKKEELVVEKPNAVEAIDIDELNVEFVRYLNFGSYPEAVFSTAVQNDAERFVKNDIIDKVLLRDLPSLYGIQDIPELNRLFTVLAYNTGNEINIDGLSKSANVAKNTLRKYLDYLEAAFLIYRVMRVDQSCKQFKRNAFFKVYLTNASMHAALFGNVDEKSDAVGRLVETGIFSQWLHARVPDSLYYSRWKKGEVDLIYLDRTQKPTWLVEIKWSDTGHNDFINSNAIQQFLELNANSLKSSIVTSKTVTTFARVANVTVQVVPASLYAYRVSSNLGQMIGFPHPGSDHVREPQADWVGR